MSFEPVIESQTGEIANLVDVPIIVMECRNNDTECFDFKAKPINHSEDSSTIEKGLLCSEVEELLTALDNWKV